MTSRDLARTLDAVANRMPGIAGLTTELRRSALVEAQTLVELEGTVDGVVRRVCNLQPEDREDR